MEECAAEEHTGSVTGPDPPQTGKPKNLEPNNTAQLPSATSMGKHEYQIMALGCLWFYLEPHLYLNSRLIMERRIFFSFPRVSLGVCCFCLRMPVILH